MVRNKALNESRQLCQACLGGDIDAFIEKDGYPFSRCPRCGFIFADPMPTVADIQTHYGEGYRNIDETFYPKARSRNRRAGVKALRFLPYLMGKRALDVGCGGGFMVEWFRRYGAQAYGLDISDVSIAYAREHFPKANFYCEDMVRFAERGLTFDFVFSTELLEHLRDTEELMHLLKSVTEPGSHVFIATPDSGHPVVPSDIKAWDQIAPPAHLQIFNQKAAEILFQRNGFDFVRRWYRRSAPALAMLFRRR